MAENVYLLKVSSGVAGDVKSRLDAKKDLSHVRVATLAPLSNYGYPPGAEGSLLKVSGDGLVFGVEGNDDVPRAFVPWQNVSYVADGSAVSKG